MKRQSVEYAAITLAAAGAVFCVVGRTTGQLLNHPIRASGIWRSSLAGEGTWTASLALNGSTITGTMQSEGWLEVGVGQVTGNLSANLIQLGMITAGELKADFVGALTGSGIEGTYQTTSGDRGQWEGSWEIDAPQLASNDWPAGTPMIAAGEVSARTPPRYLRTWARRRSAEHSWWSGGLVHAQVGGTNVLVNTVLDGGEPQNEPEIAVDPTNPNRVVAGANDWSFPGFLGIVRLGAYASTNGGSSWGQITQIPGLTNYDAGADPSLDFDAQGRVFYAGLAFDEVPPGEDGCSDTCCDVAVVLARGDWTGGTLSWNNAKVVTSVVSGEIRTLDKPWLAVDKVPGSPHLNTVHVAYARAAGTSPNCGHSYIAMKRSTDGGNTFGPSTLVSDPPLDGLDSWPIIAVDPIGCVNVIWVDINYMIKFDRCTNGGLNCGTDRAVAQINPPSNPLPGTNFTMSAIPAMAIDTYGSSTNGYIYIAWNDDRSGNSDIYFTRSTNTGFTFASAVPIAAMAQDEFFPQIAVAPNHVVYVTYYRRTSQALSTFNTYMIFSTDAGQTWSAPVQINDGGDISPVDFGGDFIGDYIGVDTAVTEEGTRINAVWMDSRRNQQDIYSVSSAGC